MDEPTSRRDDPLLLADDQALVRSALAALLSLEDDFEVVAQVGRGDEVVPRPREHTPDVALLDIEMPGLDGLAAAAALTHEVPACRVIIADHVRPARLPAAGDGIRRARLRREGRARGAARRRGPPGVRAASGSWIRRWPRRRSPAAVTADRPGRDVLVAARDGATVADIAGRLFLSEGTVRNYLSAAIAKTGSATGSRRCASPTNAAGCNAARAGQSCGRTSAAISSSCAMSLRSRNCR